MSGIGKVVSKVFNYAQRGAKIYAPTVFGTGQEVMAKAYKGAITTKNPFKGQFWQDVWTGTKEAGKAAEKHALAAQKRHGSFWKSSIEGIKTIPKKIAQGWKVGGYKAAKAGKNVLWGNIKGIFKGIGTRMPVIGSLMILGFELPNIIKATLNEGLVQGAAETVKAGARLAGGTLLGAIGTAIGGPIGGIVGFILGDWVTSKIVGKSYSERKYDEEQKLAEQTAQQAAQTTAPVTSPYGYQTQGFNPAMYQQMLYGGYNDDFMYNAINKQPQFNIQA